MRISKSLGTVFYYVDFVSRFLSWKCEICHESTRCISILFYTKKHNNIKNYCVILENISQIKFLDNMFQAMCSFSILMKLFESHKRITLVWMNQTLAVTC